MSGESARKDLGSTGWSAMDSSEDLAPVQWKRVEKLEWVQPGLLARRWELLADGRTAARMQSRGFWKQGFIAQTRGFRWRIHEPFFRPVEIHRDGDAAPRARARIGWRGHGSIERAEEPTLEWRRKGWADLSHLLTNAERFPLFEVRTGLQWFRAKGSVRLEDAGRQLPDLETLVLLTWALTMIARKRRST